MQQIIFELEGYIFNYGSKIVYFPSNITPTQYMILLDINKDYLHRLAADGWYIQ